ncbi:cupredoxin domain-containing protein [Patulibacter defluvii]|uniref:cupredoxin domain-containing protein n=1 Tax=Patulibacter defluvii TaxID=3095358 RepID=UPI002A758F65|nr:plastocyanin/azurin family copper-binding protein [Patulibacter sp. DM4]
MSRTRNTVALGAALALLALPATAGAATPTVTGTVGPGFTITLKRGSTTVRTLKAGATYRFVLRDRSSMHNFHLSGPGVNRRTSVGGTGTISFRLKIRKGTYRYVCDPHASMMRGSFRGV